MKKIECKVWVAISEKGKIHDCSTSKDWVEKDEDDVLVRGTLTVVLPKTKKRSK